MTKLWWRLCLLLFVFAGILAENDSFHADKSCGLEDSCAGRDVGHSGRSEYDDHVDASESQVDERIMKEAVNVDSWQSFACNDNHKNCGLWAESGECIANPGYMHKNCQKSCELCETTGDVDIGVEQNLDAGDGSHADAISRIISETLDYVTNTVHVDEKYKGVRDECKNRDEMCAYWKLIGECDANPSYMKLQCAAVCQTCEYISLEVRCPINPDERNALEPGDLNQMFQNITSAAEFQIFQPKILSQPLPRANLFQKVKSFFNNQDDMPWVIVLENFLSKEECESFIQLRSQLGYERSTAVGKTQFDGSTDRVVAEYRTSTNAWCDENCERNPHTQNVANKIQYLTGIPTNNSENFQLLKYTKGQFYNRHHDYIHAERDHQQGPRILTVFLYLNDVEEGGGTEFTSLNITVTPKQGRAVIWPNVLDQNPLRMDRRTFHKALPVLKGEKYGANAWLHLRDNKTPTANGCA